MAYKYNVIIQGIIVDEDSLSAQKNIEAQLKAMNVPFTVKSVNLEQVFGYDDKPVEVELAPQTQEQIVKGFVEAVQNFMDSKAQELNYDSIFTAITYENDTNVKFAKEAEAFKAWRSQVWTICYVVLDDVLAGNRTMPTKEELIAELPELVIVYD
jgi:hypothetical protein